MLQETVAKAVRDAPSARGIAPWAVSAALAVAVGVAYFLAARLGLALLLESDGVAVFWPAAGIAAGVAVSFGSAGWLPVVIGTMTATITANLLGDRNLWSSMVFAACNAGEAVLFAGLIGRFFGSPFSLGELRNVLGFFAVSIIAPAVSGIGAILGYVLFHSSTASALTIWEHWFASDAIGIVAVAPLLIGLGSADRGPTPPREALEGVLAVATATLLSGLIVFLPSEPWVDELRIALIFPVFLWMASRCGPRFTAAATSVVSFAIVWAATFGLGMFGNPNISIIQRMLSAQVDILMFSLCGLVLAALFAERRQHQAKLEESEARLQNALKAAEQADRAKSGFLAAASHDLRQPLQTLQFLQGTLERQTRNSEARASLAGIKRSLETMRDMLNALLDIDRIERGMLRVSMTEFEVNELFDSVAADFGGPIMEKGLRWCLVRSGLTVRSDRRMLEEVLRNLLSNAVRYTDRGKILLGCRRAGDMVRIEVWDSGVGIMGDQLPRIFDEYFRADEGTRPGGLGLGLAIVQRLGKMLNHPIDVHSTPGKGSVFSIQVPLARGIRVTPRFKTVGEQNAAPLPRTILVVEDEHFVRTGLESLFASEGIECVSAATGHEALTLVTEQHIRPDLVVSDYNLPGMNGVEVIHALRTAIAWKVPAIVLTGDIRSHATEAIARYDVATLVKPTDADELLQLVRRLHSR